MSYATIPCEDCINSSSPQNPLTWGYVSQLTENYDVSTGANAPTPCAGSGDVNLGIIGNLCDASALSNPPVSVRGVKYTLINSESCWGLKCIGMYVGMPNCAIESDSNPYGSCTAPWDAHFWYQRSWGDEMQLPAPNNAPFENTEQYCCFLPAGNLSDGSPRTTHCPPDVWAGSSKCQLPSQSFCSTVAPSGNAILGWSDPCDTYMQTNLQTTQGNPQFAKGLFLSSLNTWSSVFSTPNSPITKPNPQDPFIQTIFKWAPQFPGSLTAPLTQACSNVTTDDISADTTGNLARLCGCYLAPAEYYLPGVIPKECQGICALASASQGIPLYEWNASLNKAVPKSCEQTTCVIDQVTIDYANTISGGVNFSQVCGQCSGSSPSGCTCIIDGIDINATDSQISGVNFQQECGSFSTANGGSAPSPSAQVKSFWQQYKYWILGGLVLLAALVVFFLIRKI